MPPIDLRDLDLSDVTPSDRFVVVGLRRGFDPFVLCAAETLAQAEWDRDDLAECAADTSDMLGIVIVPLKSHWH